MTTATSSRAALVFNPTKADPDVLPGLLQTASREAGWADPLILETTPEHLGDGATRQALSEKVDVVLVAGGDGTVRAVSEAMAHSGVPLAIVPSGTGNLLARNLRLPLDSPRPMVHAALDGDDHPIDVGIVAITRADGEKEERAFVVMGGMGLDAAMIANTNSTLKKRLGWVAYVDGAARSLIGAKPFPIMYQVDGHRMHRSNAQSIVIANCGSLPGGLELIPEASVSDGEIDVAVFQPKGPFGWLLVWRRVAFDNSLLRKFRAGRNTLRLRTRDNSVRFTRGTAVDVAADAPHPVQLDGDEFGEARTLRCHVEKGALIVRVPRGHSLTR